MPPKVALIEPTSYKVTPWKNRKGTTEEITIFPPDSTVAENNFLWRLSLAVITEEGPFSDFPGYDRYLALVEGAGVRLFQQDGTALAPQEGVYIFPGEAKIHGTLVDGATKDLNLMVKRGEVRGRFALVNGDRPTDLELTGEINLLFNLGEAHRVRLASTQVEYTMRKQATLQVDLPPDTRDSIHVEGKAPFSFAVIELATSMRFKSGSRK